MKTIGSILISLFIFSQAGANDLIHLPDIAPNYEDRQSPEEIKKVEEQLLEDFADIEENSFSVQSLDTLRSYNYVDPNKVIPRSLLNPALNFYNQNKHRFSNQKFMTVVDFSKRSNQKRFFVINMDTGNVYGFRVAHGAGGDVDNDGYVEAVSNISGSHMSSKGFYKVSEIYYGKYGRSIRLDGLSSTNSKVRSRAIVIHGSDYVKEANVLQGRSWGCFALSWEVKDDIVDVLHSGSLLYANYSD